jgi:hypothetical protein
MAWLEKGKIKVKAQNNGLQLKKLSSTHPLRKLSSGSKYIWGDALHSSSPNQPRDVREGPALAYIDTQFEMDTMNAVPTPRFDVGENVFAAQLLLHHELTH